MISVTSCWSVYTRTCLSFFEISIEYFTHVLFSARSCLVGTNVIGPLLRIAVIQTERFLIRIECLYGQFFHRTRYLQEVWHRLLCKAIVYSPKKLLSSKKYSIQLPYKMNGDGYSLSEFRYSTISVLNVFCLCFGKTELFLGHFENIWAG